MADGTATARAARFARAKFRPPVLPATLVTRPALHGLLAAGASQRLTLVVGSAGAGKSVLLAGWAAAREPGTTSWLSCDRPDADPVRFWTGFAEAARAIEPGFGIDAADLLLMDGRMSADVTASIVNDAAKLPRESAIIVDDFHYASAAAKDMTDLVERWPAETAQLILAARFDPALGQHRLRMSGELCEIRDRDLYFSLAESRDLLANFGVRIGEEELGLLHRRSEGWAAALQMAALSLRGPRDPAQVAQALAAPNGTIAAYFVSEVLEQQPPEVAQFMLDTSILGTLAADVCAAITGMEGAAAMLRHIDAAHLFLVALDDARTTFRYHHLVRQVLRAELRARDQVREQQLQLRAAEWYESAGEARRAARHFISASQADRALGLLQDKVVPDFVADPVTPGPLDLGVINRSRLAEAPDRLLAVAADLLLGGDTARSGQYLDVLKQTQPPALADPRLAARFTAMRAFQHAMTGHLDEAVDEALAARAIQEDMRLMDEWNLAVPLLLMDVYNCLEDFPAVEREATAALAVPTFTDVVRQVVVPGARALAWFEAGRLAQAAKTAEAADAQARQLGFSEHFFAVDHLRALAGIALEQRDLDAAERLIERVLAIIEQRRPLLEFLALLDRSAIWAARGQVRDALTTVAAARTVLERPPPVLLARADESEALIRLAAGDRRSPAQLADRLPAGRRDVLLAKVALAGGDHATAQHHLQACAPGQTPREELVRHALLAAVAIERGDPAAAGIVGGVLQAARNGCFLNTVVTSAPQVASYVIMHSGRRQRDPFTERMADAALEVHAAQQPVFQAGHVLTEPLTAAEQRILGLLPTSTYLEIAATLYISRNTVKTHLRSIYQKLGVGSRAEAIERAIDLHLL